MAAGHVHVFFYYYFYYYLFSFLLLFIVRLLADVVRHCVQLLICYMSRVCHALALLGDVTILEPCSIFMLRYPSRLGLY